MKIIHRLDDMQRLAFRARAKGMAVGLVPTMGALHEGHASLVRRARRENDVVVATLFVNPLQFGPQEDFRKYPRTPGADRKAFKALKVDILFEPSAREMFPDGFQTRVEVADLARHLCGPFRPGHFAGVATVMTQLLTLTVPAAVYMGEKDFQQARVVERLMADLHLPTVLRLCPTVREPDGLAMSSRNRYLSKREREQAVLLYQTLYLGRELVEKRILRSIPRLEKRMRQILGSIPRSRIDYLTFSDPVTLEPMKTLRRPALLAAAIRLGGTRLIDNLIVS